MTSTSVIGRPVPTVFDGQIGREEELPPSYSVHLESGRTPKRTLISPSKPYSLPDVDIASIVDNKSCLDGREHHERMERELKKQQIKSYLRIFIRIPILLVLLYFFVCSLDLLATSFRLLSGKHAGDVISNSPLIQNPVVGVMIGILVTVLLQSSSTSTSLIVSLVTAEILTVRTSVPLIMGANIGTSVTNSLVSLTQIGDTKKFDLAFSCAVVHDVFNWMAVITLLPIEASTNAIEKLSFLAVDQILPDSSSSSNSTLIGNGFRKPPNLLKSITQPFTNRIYRSTNRF